MPTLDEILHDLCMVREIDRVQRGHVRMETKFKYPDGGSIDLFVKHSHPDLFLATRTLTDFGQTMSWLADMQVRPAQSKKRQRFVDDALRVLDVKQNGGALECDFEVAHDSLEDAVIRLGQACVRVADLAFTRRSLPAPATEEVEEMLAEADLRYEPDATLVGQFGNVVTVDFLVWGRRSQSALLTLSSQTTHAAHASTNEVLRKLIDLEKRDEQRVTVYDDRFENVYKPEDLKRIEQRSVLVPLSDHDEAVALLAA